MGNLVRMLLTVAIIIMAAPAVAKPLGPTPRANTTILYYDPHHGTQVEYYAPGGRAFLWYPGNQRVVAGYFEYQRGPEGIALACSKYGPNSYNPVTGTRGGDWECTLFSINQKSIREQVDGDVFGLASGRVPFVLSKKRTTMKALAKHAGIRTPKASPQTSQTLPSASTTIQAPPKGSPVYGLPLDIEKSTCKQLLAAAGLSKANAHLAANALRRGEWMGKPCSK